MRGLRQRTKTGVDSMKFTVLDHSRENTNVFDSRAEATEKAAGIKQMVSDPGEIEVLEGSYASYNDWANARPDEPDVDPEIVDHSPEPQEPQEAEEAIDQLGESLEDDPLSILPGHMQDTIQGQPAINKRGYAMIAERFGIEAHSEIVTYPWENEANRCVAKAEAITEDGKTYTGHATASAGDGDMEEQLIELAETRSLKRAVSWASGLGIVAYEELTNEL
jgi:hypothetical protein